LNERAATPYVHTETDVAEISSETRAIPRSLAQVNVAIAAGAIGIAPPVFERRHMKIEGAAR
jgi:hypothetical protein